MISGKGRTPIRILYLGDTFVQNTCGHRAEALRRLGHEVTGINPQEAIPSSRYVTSFNVRTGFRLFECRVRRRILREMADQRFDLVWVDGGQQLGPRLHRELARRGLLIVNYNVDDPFGTRDHRKWDLYKRSVPYHDLTVVVRKENIAEARAHGARSVHHVFRSYDPVAHAPLPLTDEECRKWAAEVVFVGSWMPERGPFMVRLLELGVPLTIWGDHWRKAREWGRLQTFIRGPSVYGPDYVRAIQCAKVALGLLSKGNRDLHTQRSAEVPFIAGAVFCAERTDEHERLYRNGEEALFWSTAEECAARCRELLPAGDRRRRIAVAARSRVEAWRLSNDEVLASILRVLAGEPAAHPLAS